MSGPRALEEHNLRQRRYYQRAFKPNLEPSGSPYLVRQLERLLRAARLAPGRRVLEVGCGLGRYTLLLAERGFAVEGLDLSPELVQGLRERNAGRYEIPLHCADLLELPASMHGAFDAVLGFFVLHHLHDLELSFAAMRRLLAPGGRVAFVEPNPYNPLYYAQIALTPGMTWEGDRGILRMRRRVVLPAMERAGLAHPTLSRFGFLPPFLVNRPAGARWEAQLERALPAPLRPFQLFLADRA